MGPLAGEPLAGFPGQVVLGGALRDDRDATHFLQVEATPHSKG